MSLFSLGRLVQTIGVAGESQRHPAFACAVLESFERHRTGDWGDLCADDKALNDSAVSNNDDRILSAYILPASDGPKKIYIITEYDRSVTTILFADEY